MLSAKHRCNLGKVVHVVRLYGTGDLVAEKKDGIGLVLVGARFDDSRMFDLLDYIRKSAGHKKIPIVAAVVGVMQMSKATVSGLAYASKIFGASVFVNLNDFDDNETENTRLRLLVNALLLPPSIVPVVAEKLDLQPGADRV